jgi:epoxyqueuosine reductase
MSKRSGSNVTSTSGFRNEIEAGKLDTNHINLSVSDLIKEYGFDTFGIIQTFQIPNLQNELNEFLTNQHHGEMYWMQEHSHLRSDPKILWPDVKSIIVLGSNYHNDCNSLGLLNKKDKAIISVYARNEDYHKVIKKKLKKLSLKISEIMSCNFKYFVDTAPVMEKPLGMQAGLGWQGKHTNLVSKEFGSWLFLSSIFLNKEITETKKESDHCGSCSSCIDICPTNAIIAPYKIDARRCISYLTIEHKGQIDKEYRSLIGNRIYGCDDCLAVCPWNKFAKKTNENSFQPRDDLIEPDLKSLIHLDDQEFRAKFRSSSIKRIGRDRFIRNVLIAIGNSKNIDFVDQILILLRDKSDIVRAMAVWALKQISSLKDFNKYKDKHLNNEKNEQVLQEWIN